MMQAKPLGKNRLKNRIATFINIISLVVVVLGCSSKPTANNANQADGPVAVTTGELEPSIFDAPVRLQITSPRENEVLSTTDVPVSFELKNYEVKPDGQHVHVILDNEPYQPCYDVSKPFVLKGIKPGVHTIRAFPARAWHESVKDPTAFATRTFYVEKKEGKSPVRFSRDPLLTYSRPKGKYEGEKAHKILLDFWVKNAELRKDGYKVRYTIDAEAPVTLEKWAPTYLENLSPGKHKIKLELLSKSGKAVKGAYNVTEREIEVVK